MTVNEWCGHHGINKANYYYRLKQVRKAYLSQPSNKMPEPPIVLVSITTGSYSSHLSALEISTNGFSAQVTDTTSSNFEWIIPRNKTIDRFLRKSNRIYNEVYISENKHMLSFFLEGKGIYSIPYDDICYPENAIRIMTDDILRNLKKK